MSCTISSILHHPGILRGLTIVRVFAIWQDTALTRDHDCITFIAEMEKPVRCRRNQRGPSRRCRSAGPLTAPPFSPATLPANNPAVILTRVSPSAKRKPPNASDSHLYSPPAMVALLFACMTGRNGSGARGGSSLGSSSQAID